MFSNDMMFFRQFQSLVFGLSLYLFVGNSVAQSGPLNYVALVIGNGQYKEGALRGPENDASDMASLLTESGFRVINSAALVNLEKVSMLNEINRFVATIDRNTVAVVYYSGHGVEVSNANYLAPIDADGRSIDQLIPLDYLLTRLEQRDARSKVIILDACRNLPPSLRYAKSLGGGLADLKAVGAGTTIVYAAEPGSIAQAAPTGQRNSVFTAAILAAVNLDSTFNGVIGRAAGITAEKTNQKQKPWLMGHIAQTIPIGRGTPGVKAPECFVFNSRRWCE
jgi:uncharacterized caspase-like protein